MLPSFLLKSSSSIRLSLYNNAKAPKSEGTRISKYIITIKQQPSGEEQTREVSADQKSLQISVVPGAKYKFKVEAVADDARVSRESSFSEITGGVVTARLGKEKLTEALEAMGKTVPTTTAAIVARLRGANCFDRMSLEALHKALKAVGGRIGTKKDERIASLKAKLTEELAKFDAAPPEKQLSAPEVPEVEVEGPETLKVTWKAALAESCDVSSYVVKAKALSGGEVKEKTVSGNVTTATITAAPGTTYKVRIEARVDGLPPKESPWSDPTGAALGTLEAPQVKGLGPDLVEVTWKAPPSTGIVVSSYVIKRQLLPNGELEEVKTVPGNETTTTISVDPGKKYKFNLTEV